MASILKHWREAATLIIIAPKQSSTLVRNVLQNNNSNTSKAKEESRKQNINKKGKPKGFYDADYDYETILLKRSTKSKFMPDVFVFPGGTSENNDFSSEWISVFQKVGKNFQQSMFDKVSEGSSKASPMFTRKRNPEYSAMPPEVSFRISAIRETFEESGILIAKHVEEFMEDHKKSLLSNQWNTCSCLSMNELKKWRSLVNDNPDNFLKMCKELDLIPDILSLYEWSNWLTPTVMKVGGKAGRRYDTIFYICCLDHKPDAKEDTFETVDFEWFSPASLLSAYYSNQGIGLAPPQIYESSRLLKFNNATEVMEFSAQRECERVERWLPVVIFSEDALISLKPGDDLYPKDLNLYTSEMIHHDMTMEELNRNVKNFHRSYSIRGEGPSHTHTIFNIEFKNKHVGPVSNVGKEFIIQSKL